MNKKIIGITAVIIIFSWGAINWGNFNISGKAVNGNNETILSFSTIMQGKDIGITYNKTAVVKNSSDWDSLWRELYPNNFMSPSINFSKITIIGVFAGSKPNGRYDSYISKIIKYPDKVEVLVEEIIPGDTCFVTSGISQPYHVVVLDKIEQPVEFLFEEQRYNC